MSAFAAINPSMGTSVRRVTDCAGPKKLETVLRMAKITQICRMSVTKTSSTTSPARMRSLAIITLFTFQWSTNTPAMGPTMVRGNTKAMVIVVTSSTVPCQRYVIIRITPKSARKSPKMLTNWASHMMRNGRCCRIVLRVYGVGVGEAAILERIKFLGRVASIQNSAKPVKLALLQERTTMKHKRFIFVIALFTLALTAFAQQPDKSKRPSPPGTAEVTLKQKRITVDYSRPSLKGRKAVGGQLVPYGQVWRTGANEATALTTEADLNVGGVNVPAGKYTLYTLPSEGTWKLIISKQTGQWGTIYNEDQDLARVDMQKTALEQPVEQFTISF